LPTSSIANIVYPTGKLVFIIVHLRTFLPANLQDILEPGCHEDSGHGSLLFQDGICDDGSTVDETLHSRGWLSGKG